MINERDFKLLMEEKAAIRKNRVKEVRIKERERRKQIETDYINLITLLKSFRDYTFIVLRTDSKKVMTIYSDSSFNTVKSIIESIEKHYYDTGELFYTIFRTFIDEED